jgi:hypothetical protein
MSSGNIIEFLENILNSHLYSGVDLDYLNKTTFYSIFDLLKILQTQYNKLKNNFNRYEWLTSLAERIDHTPMEDENYGLINEIEIQNLSNSDKAFLQHHCGFPMFNERAYQKNRHYREKYDQMLLRFSETLNDDGVADLTHALLGMPLDEYERRINELEITLTTITQIVNTLIEKKGHKDVLLKSQMKDICIACRKLQLRKAKKLEEIQKQEAREERKERVKTFRIKPMIFHYDIQFFNPSTEYECLRELFELELDMKPLKHLVKIHRKNKQELKFEILGGRYDCETLQLLRSFLSTLELVTQASFHTTVQFTMSKQKDHKLNL